MCVFTSGDIVSYSATVYKVLIYLSSDLSEERNDILEAIRLWNEKNSQKSDVVLMPVVWQDGDYKSNKNDLHQVFQSRLINDFDIFLNFFWTRLDGSSNLNIAKIIEDIDKLNSSNKSVLLFFYTMPVFSQSIDHSEYQKLIELKLNFDKEGITDNFESTTELEQKVELRLSKIIDEFKGMEVTESSTTPVTTSDFETKHHDKQNVIKNVSSYITSLRKNFQESEIKKEGEVTLNKLFNKGDDLIKSLKEAVVVPVSKENDSKQEIDTVELVDEETESVKRDLKKPESPPQDKEENDDVKEEPKKSPSSKKEKVKPAKKAARSRQKTKKVEKKSEAPSKTSKKEDSKLKKEETKTDKQDNKKDYLDESLEKAKSNIKLPQLGEIKEEILKILGEAEKIGIESIGEAEILNATQLSEMDVSYNLVALTDDKFISSIYVKDKPPQYKIAKTGMDYLKYKDLL